MISKKHTYILIFTSLILTIALVLGGLFVFAYSNDFGTNGKDTSGLKYEISLAQVASKQIKAVPSIKMKHDDAEKKSVSADLSQKNLKKKIKEKRKTPQKSQKKRSARKRVIDKGTLGKLNSIYAGILQSTIKRHMLNPLNLNRNRTVHVRFRIDASGSIVLASIHKSSGKASIDRLAMRTVYLSAPFQAPPISIRKTDMTYIIPLVYSLNK